MEQPHRDIEVVAGLNPATEKFPLEFQVVSSPVLCSAFSLAVAISVAVVQQLHIERHIYWDRGLVVLACLISLFANGMLFHKQLKENKIQHKCPRRGWFMYYPRLQHETGQQRRFYGHLLQSVGLIFGILNVISTGTQFIVLQSGGKEELVKFSYLPLGFQLVMLLKNLFPDEFEPLFNITVICGGQRHSCRARLRGFNIEAHCHIHPQAQPAAPGDPPNPNPVYEEANREAGLAADGQRQADQGGNLQDNIVNNSDVDLEAGRGEASGEV